MKNAVIGFFIQLLARIRAKSPKFWIALRWIFGILLVLSIGGWLVDKYYPWGLDHIIFSTITWKQVVEGFISFSLAIWGATFATIQGIWDSIQKKIVPVVPKKENENQG